MDFAPTEAQQDLSGLTRDLLTAWSAEHPDTIGFDRTLWTTLADTGILEAALPITVGGTGFGLLEQCSILIEIGRTVAPVPYLGSIAVCAAALAQFGTAHQIERWLSPILRGETTLAPALAGAHDRVRAEQSENRWRITGSRSVVPGGSFADAFLVEAQTESGALLAVVDRHTYGLNIQKQRVVDVGDAALLEFNNVLIPADAIVGTPPTHTSADTGNAQTHASADVSRGGLIPCPGTEAAAWARRRATLAACAHQLGVLERALEMTAEYALLRRQFDKPIGSFQAVRQRLADALIDVEAVRLSLWQAAWGESSAHPTGSALAVAAFWSAEAGHRVAHTAVHIHASTGIYLDYPLHRHFAAAKRTEFATGGATAHLRSLGDLLAAEPS